MSEAILIGGGLAVSAPAQGLTPSESYALHAHEQVIERGLATFHEVGTALLAIRDGRLYRSTHKTFEDYCQARWSMTHRRADQLIEASEVMRNLGNIVSQKPANARQAAELAKLEDADQVLAWKTIIETAPGGKVTAGYVKAVAETLQEIRDTGHMTIGEEAAIPASEVFQARLTHEAHELLLRQREHINASQTKRAHVANNSGEFEWYTPAPLIEAARAAMGGIDCDPATSEIANRKVKARTIYTLENSGLDFANTWKGNVWLNPPYAQPLIEEFCARLLDQIRRGYTAQACLLVNNATETAWFQSLLSKRAAVCLLRSRVKFENPDGEPIGSPLQGQAVLYFGDAMTNFFSAFAPFGALLSVR